MKIPCLSIDELDIMKIIWSHGKIEEKELIQELLDQTEWKLKYIEKLINSLKQNTSIIIDISIISQIIYTPRYSEDEFNNYHIFYNDYHKKHHFFNGKSNKKKL